MLWDLKAKYGKTHKIRIALFIEGEPIIPFFDGLTSPNSRKKLRKTFLSKARTSRGQEIRSSICPRVPFWLWPSGKLSTH